MCHVYPAACLMTGDGRASFAFDAREKQRGQACLPQSCRARTSNAKQDAALPPSPVASTMLLELICSLVLQIPQNAFMLDFVFSDVESGDGTYDNQGGKDYHLPVEGSKASTLNAG